MSITGLQPRDRRENLGQITCSFSFLLLMYSSSLLFSYTWKAWVNVPISQSLHTTSHSWAFCAHTFSHFTSTILTADLIATTPTVVHLSSCSLSEHKLRTTWQMEAEALFNETTMLATAAEERLYLTKHITTEAGRTQEAIWVSHKGKKGTE